MPPDEHPAGLTGARSLDLLLTFFFLLPTTTHPPPPSLLSRPLDLAPRLHTRRAHPADLCVLCAPRWCQWHRTNGETVLRHPAAYQHLAPSPSPRARQCVFTLFPGKPRDCRVCENIFLSLIPRLTTYRAWRVVTCNGRKQEHIIRQEIRVRSYTPAQLIT